MAIKHGLYNTPVWNVWKDMKKRCLNKANRSYPGYGGRGIKVCDRWLTFANFFEDMGHPPPGLTIERIDNDGNYEPSNCCWATKTEQSRNTRRTPYLIVGGKKLPVRDIERQLGLSKGVINQRLKRGMSPEEAATKPSQHKQRRPVSQNTRAEA